MDERSVLMMFACLLCVCGALLYFDWRRQGEIEFLHGRVDEHDDAFSEVTKALVALRPASTTERILRAADDRTLADIAREGAR